MNLSEWHIYGSSRLGIYQTSINMAYRNVKIENSVTTQENNTTVALPSYTLFDIQRGAKRYELTNHLGNVLVVVTDKKISNCPTEIANFNFSTTPNLNGAWNIKNSFAGQNATISVVSQKLHINDNQTSDPYARVNYFMPSDLIKNHLYKVEIDIAKLNNKGSGIWLLDVDYNANINAYGGTIVRYNLTEGTNIINFTAPGYIWRFRFIYSIAQQDIEYTFDNFKLTDITTGETINYMADVVSATDYSPFGAPLAGRTYTAPNISYRFSFNGKEKDDEVKGGGNQQDYGMRIYDNRLGRFLSVDPLAHKMPAWSPYSFSFNNPILYVDPDGAFPIEIHVRSFAPFDYFGGGLWKGDGNNRRFSTIYNGNTSRIRQITSYETTTMASNSTAYGGQSHSRYGANAFSDAKIEDDFSFGNRVYTHLSGDNDALVPGVDYGGPTHDIDVWTDVHIGVTENKDGSSILSLTGDLAGDGFPSSEAFVTDGSGKNKVFLGVGAAKAGPDKGPFVTLAGDKKEKQFDINVRIAVDKKGNFTGVYSTDKKGKETIIPIADWNKQFESQSPK